MKPFTASTLCVPMSIVSEQFLIIGFHPVSLRNISILRACTFLNVSIISYGHLYCLGRLLFPLRKFHPSPFLAVRICDSLSILRFIITFLDKESRVCDFYSHLDEPSKIRAAFPMGIPFLEPSCLENIPYAGGRCPYFS